MKNSIFEKLIRAIDGHNVVLLRDYAGERTIEVYLLHETAAGDMSLHGWQRSGAADRQPPPTWINRHLEDILAVEISSERFERPHAGYKPDRFHRVIYQIETKGPGAQGAPATHSRVHAPRRRSPPKGGMVARRNGGGTKRRQRWS